MPGAKTIISDSLSLDATYLLTEDWRVNGFWTYSYNRWNGVPFLYSDNTTVSQPMNQSLKFLGVSYLLRF